MCPRNLFKASLSFPDKSKTNQAERKAQNKRLPLYLEQLREVMLHLRNQLKKSSSLFLSSLRSNIDSSCLWKTSRTLQRFPFHLNQPDSGLFMVHSLPLLLLSPNPDPCSMSPRFFSALSVLCPSPSHWALQGTRFFSVHLFFCPFKTVFPITDNPPEAQYSTTVRQALMNF